MVMGYSYFFLIIRCLQLDVHLLVRLKKFVSGDNGRCISSIALKLFALVLEIFLIDMLVMFLQTSGP